MVRWKKLLGLDGSHDRTQWREEARRCKYFNGIQLCNILTNDAVLPQFHEDQLPSAIDPTEVTKVALRIRYLIEQTIPCEMEEDVITKAHSQIITHGVIKAAKGAGGKEFGACVVYCLLVNKRWFKQQAQLELYDADLHDVRAVACEVVAKRM